MNESVSVIDVVLDFIFSYKMLGLIVMVWLASSCFYVVRGKTA